jgi:peptide/nickel transport system ATP-binding protein
VTTVTIALVHRLSLPTVARTRAAGDFMTEPSPSRTISNHPSGDPLLVVENLKTHFEIDAGMVKAVDGVSFTLERGKTLGVVGESGSGKTVLSRSVMRLNIAPNVHTSGSVRYDGEELLGKTSKQMQNYWGAEMAMVFQDPMTSLIPVVRLGGELT